MDLTVDCHDVDIRASGISAHGLRVKLRDLDTTDLDDVEVYDAIDIDQFCKHREVAVYNAIDVKAFCEHHSLELKEE